MTGPELAAAKSEIDMLTQLQHDGIARCRGSWQDEKHLYSVEEYGIRGDLFVEMFSERCVLVQPVLLVHKCIAVTSRQAFSSPHERQFD
jgi:hypothetical protein